MNQEKRILVCEDSMEGIFSAVYDGWKECAGGCKVSIQTSFPVSMELFTSYREIATDQSKAGKVMRTILMRLGSEVYEQICLAAAILGLSVAERLAEDFCWRRSSRGMISCLLWLLIFPIAFPMRTG